MPPPICQVQLVKDFFQYLRPIRTVFAAEPEARACVPVSELLDRQQELLPPDEVGAPTGNRRRRKEKMEEGRKKWERKK